METSMTNGQDRPLKLVKDGEKSSGSYGAALAEAYKALKVLSFYPQGHPLLAESLLRAHQAFCGMLKGGGISLLISRNGFSLADGGAIDGNPMAQTLAGELFIRRVQRLTILPDLTPEDLRSFLALLAIDPREIAGGGGMGQLMGTRRIRTIWANEIDMSVILAKRQTFESGAGEPEGEGEECLSAEPAGGAAAIPPSPAPDKAIHEIIALMDHEFDDNRYPQLAELLAVKAGVLKAENNCSPLLPVLLSLRAHGADERRSQAQRECARSTLEQVAEGGMAAFLVLQLEGREFSDKEKLYPILKQLAATVTEPLIDRLCAAETLAARKLLATALVRIGDPAVPFLTSMLKDERWFVVRNMAAILGEIGNRDCVKTLKLSAYHQDNRVRKEAIRSLAKIGGAESEAVLIGLLTTREADVKGQAILWLGVMKSHLAVQPLLEIVRESDMFMSSLPLKLEALQAIGRIGDRRAVPQLLALVKKRRWLTWRSWEPLTTAAVAAIGRLGDESAVEALREMAARGGRLGKACADALDQMERPTEGADG